MHAWPSPVAHSPAHHSPTTAFLFSFFSYTSSSYVFLCIWTFLGRQGGSLLRSRCSCCFLTIEVHGAIYYTIGCVSDLHLIAPKRKSMPTSSPKHPGLVPRSFVDSGHLTLPSSINSSSPSSPRTRNLPIWRSWSPNQSFLMRTGTRFFNTLLKSFLHLSQARKVLSAISAGPHQLSELQILWIYQVHSPVTSLKLWSPGPEISRRSSEIMEWISGNATTKYHTRSFSWKLNNTPKISGGETLAEHVYSHEPESTLTIGKRNQGHVSNYYLGSPITDEEVAAIQRQAELEEVDVLNTRRVTITQLPCSCTLILLYSG